MPSMNSYILTVYLKDGTHIIYRNITRSMMKKYVKQYQELGTSLTFKIDWVQSDWGECCANGDYECIGIAYTGVGLQSFTPYNINQKLFLGSSVVEQVTVNDLVGGSSPSRGANNGPIV